MASSRAAETCRRMYTAESANRALPLVRVIVRDIVTQWQVVSELERRLAPHGHEERRAAPVDSFREELEHRRAELEVEQNRLRDFLNELERLGVELKSVENGLCDFPSIRDGHEVYLCWKLGEPAVEYWHELDAGVAGRTPLDASRSRTTGRGAKSK